MTLPDGTSFLILNSGSTMIGFSGKSADVTRAGAVSALPVRFVNVGAPGKEPNAIPATGECRSDRSSGATACSASTGQGRFEAVFQRR